MATTILIFVEHLKSIFKHAIIPQNIIFSSRYDFHIGCDTFIHKRLSAYREELAACANSHTSAMRKVYDKRSPGQADLIEHLIRVRAVALEDDMGGASALSGISRMRSSSSFS